MSLSALPTDFDVTKFNAILKENLAQLIGFVSVGDRVQWLQEYNQRITECLVSSSQFNSFSDDKRVELIETHFNIMHALKILFERITPEVTTSETEVAQYVRSLRF